MKIHEGISLFLEKAKDWINNDYILDILYVSRSQDNSNQIYSVFIVINPLISHTSSGFLITPANFTFGHLKNLKAKKSFITSLLKKAVRGLVEIEDIKLELPNHTAENFYSNMVHRDVWFSPLHIKLQGKAENYTSSNELSLLDHELRKSSPPFDGLNDVLGHLGFPNVIESLNSPYIEIVINPPVDLDFEKTILSKNIFTVVLLAHKNFEESSVRLTIRTMPGHSLDNRKDITSEIVWKTIRGQHKIGEAKIELSESDSILTMLMINDHTVRRQWFSDKEKTRNIRLLPILNFDKDLSKTKSALFNDSDSKNFEKAIANLLFIHGFHPCQPVDTEAPDVIAATPNGKIIIVECTTRIADFSNKLGKLVDRRGSLKKALIAQNTPIEPIAILICRLPNDQIAAKKDEIKEHQVIFLTYENISDLFNNARTPFNADAFIENELNKISKSNNLI